MGGSFVDVRALQQRIILPRLISYSDEADVFLENRINSSDTNRNALVSGEYEYPSAECS